MRKIFILMLSFTLVFGVVACGGEESEPETAGMEEGSVPAEPNQQAQPAPEADPAPETAEPASEQTEESESTSESETASSESGDAVEVAGVDINSASVSELSQLNGVGAVTAQSIVDYRDENGPFGSVEELDDVSGIGPATVENIKNTGAAEETSSGDDPEATTETSGDPININTASQSELETLTGVGPVTAESIFNYREDEGEFGSVDELTSVSGIGPATLDKLPSEVTVE